MQGVPVGEYFAYSFTLKISISFLIPFIELYEVSNSYLSAPALCLTSLLGLRGLWKSRDSITPARLPAQQLHKIMGLETFVTFREGGGPSQQMT